MRRWYRRIVTGILGGVLAAASSGGCRGAGARPAAAVVADPAAVTAPAPLAVIPVHVVYQLSALQPVLDASLPPFDSLSRNQCAVARGLVCHRYVYRRQPFVLAAHGERLSVETSLQYRAAVGAPGVDRVASCGYAPEPMRRARFGMQTSLYWRRDWRIGARSTQFAASLVDACKVSFLGVDATGSISSLLDRQLATFAAVADSAIPAAADLKPLADSLWASFQEPAPLDSAGSLWLLVSPEDIRATPLIGAGTSIRTTLVLYARPSVVAGSKPRRSTRPLPAVQLGEGGEAFDVPLSVTLPYADIERRATAFLREETRGASVHVDDVRVAAHGDSLSIDLDVAGGLTGQLSLRSRPRWDAASRELLMDGLEWSLASRGLLSRMKGTLASPLIARAIRRATLGGRVPIGAQLDSSRAELMRKLNGTVSPGVAMASSVTSLDITTITLAPQAIVVHARLRGEAHIYIR